MSFSLTRYLQDAKVRVIHILLIALLVRLIGIISRPIWYDEAFSILFSEKGLGQMLYGTVAHTGIGSAEEHPLGYYTILWIWIKLFGESILAARTLSVIAGLLIVYLIYRISLELFDSKTTETAMLIAALAPFLIHYSQEIRMYVFLTLWLMLAVYSYLRGLKSGNWHWWIVFALSSAFAQYTHSLAVFFLIPLALTPVYNKDWKTLRAVVLAGGFAILIYSPWLIQLPSQFTKVNNGYWVEKPGISSLFNLIITYTTNTPLPSSWVLPAIILAILILIIGIRQTIRARNDNTWVNGLWVLYLSFAMPTLLFIFSQWIPVYIERALLPSSTFFCIWLAWVINNTNLPNPGRITMGIMLAVVFSMGIYQHINYHDFPYGPFKEITSFLDNHIETGDVIVHSNKLSMLPSLYFDNSLPQFFIGDLPGSVTNTLAPATQQVLGVKAETDLRSAVQDAERVWYIIYQGSIDEYTQAGKPTYPDIEYLNSEFTLESQKIWDGLQILLYTRTP